MTHRPLALVRSVPAAFARALVAGRPGRSLDPARARRQHAGYCRALHDGGFVVETIPGDESHPDSPFIEDTAVVIGDHALITRPGHPSRRGEVGPVAAALERHVAIRRTPEHAHLDGGDVLQVGGTIYVGRSSRTDDAGIEILRELASSLGRAVVPVDVRGVLHLKTAVTAIDEQTVLVAPGVIDLEPFRGVEVVAVGSDDPEAANVVRLPDRSILVASHHEETARLVRRRGLRPVMVDVSEFAAADGGLTCLSLRLRSPLAPAAPKLGDRRQGLEE